MQPLDQSSPPPAPPDPLFDLLDHLPAAILIVALPDFRIQTINARACGRLGIRVSSDLIGKPCAAAIPRFHEDRLGETWLAAAGMQALDLPGTQVSGGGAVGRRWQVSPLRDARGEVDRLLVYRIESPGDGVAKPEQQFAASTHQIAQALISTLDRDRLLNLILEQLRSVVSYDSASILLRDRQGYYVAAERGSLNRDLVLSLRYEHSDVLFREIEQAQDAIILRDAMVEARFKSPLGPIRGWMGVPLRVRGEVIGVLTVDSITPNRYTKADAARAQAFAAYAALAVRNAELYHRAREHSAKLEQALADLRVAQRRLVQSERLSAVGELVAGVAHELNNPLTAVLGFASILQQTAPADLQPDIMPIVEGANRARRIVQNLLTFARQRDSHLEVVDVNQSVERVLSLYGYLLRSDNVTVDLRLTPDLPTTLADTTAIQQVLLNLVNNARQALAGWAGQRTITITTQGVPEDAPQQLVVKVADTGPGILPEHIEHIFEPFFTTKPVGEGTGLGLSICYGIVKQYRGEIRVESEPGRGACFIVELPVYIGPDQGEEIEPSLPPAPVATHRILVVDDDPAVSAMIVRMLQGRGYATDVCAGSVSVEEMLDRGAYDLVISDIKATGEGGALLYEVLQRRPPHERVPLLFITGDTVSRATREFLASAGCPYLEKPFAIDEFIATVQRILEE